MEQIIEKRIIYGQEFVYDWYVSIDGLGFRWSDDCKNHEEYINKRIEQYEMFLDMGIYTPEQLYALGKVLQNRL